MNMQRSTKKLSSSGIIIFNFATHIDYTKIAEKCVSQCKKHLKQVPIMSVGQPIAGADLHHALEVPQHNKKVFNGISKVWHNLARHHAYDISPWQTTVVIDSDYMIFSNQLQKLLKSKQQILMHRQWYDIANNTTTVTRVGNSAIDMLWATVLKFDRTPEVEKFFLLWRRVIKHYHYYAKLFGFSSHVIRNDYAVSIALKQLMDFGEVEHCVIPWDIHTTRDTIKVKSFSENGIRLSDNHSVFDVTSDCHVLDKESLLHAC